MINVFLNKPVKIFWERIVIPEDTAVFKIFSTFQLNDEIFVIIYPFIDGKILGKERLVRLNDIKSIIKI